MFGACTSYNANGELVRHHFGYVKVIMPAIHTPLKSDEECREKGNCKGTVHISEIETYGVWAHSDGRSQTTTSGNGAGLGYQKDRREMFLPHDCRVIFRAKNRQQMKEFLDILKEESREGESICAVRD